MLPSRSRALRDGPIREICPTRSVRVPFPVRSFFHTGGAVDRYPAPIPCTVRHVEPTWIDANGHMNMAFYLKAFDEALDEVYDRLGVGGEYLEREGGSTFTLEAHVNYLREVLEGDPLRIAWQLLDFDPKRIHFFMTMHHDREGYLAATTEQLSIHVDLASRRSAPMPAGLLARLEAVRGTHGALPRPEQAGGSVGIRRRPA